MSTLTPSYGSAVAFTVTSLDGLATDTNLLAGWQSAAVDNTSALSDDELITAVFKVGSTAPTANTTIEVWAYGTLDDTPTYPDTITGSQGTVTLTSLNTKNSGLAFAGNITVDSTANRLYALRPTSVASLFGGTMPKKWGLFVVHNTGVSLGTTQSVSHIPVQYQNGSGGGVSTTDPRFNGIERTDICAAYGAYCDGTSHPLSAIGLTAAQAKYPNIGLTGSTDLTKFETDTAAWLQCEYDLRTGAGGIIGLRNSGTMMVSQTLYMQDATRVWFHGARGARLFTNQAHVAGVPAIRVSGAGEYAMPLSYFAMLAQNNPVYTSTSGGGVAHTGYRANAVAMTIDESSHFVINSIHWNGYDNPILWGQDTYVCRFQYCTGDGNNIGLTWSQTTGLNSMENMGFEACNFSNNNIGISWNASYGTNSQGGSVFVRGCSIDYNIVRHIVYTGMASGTPWVGNSFHVRDCHIETTGACSGSSLCRVYSNGKMSIEACELYEGDGTVPPGYAEITDYGSTTLTNNSINNTWIPLLWSPTSNTKAMTVSGNYYQSTQVQPIALSDAAGIIMQPFQSTAGQFTYYGSDPNPGPLLSDQGRLIELDYTGNFTLTADSGANHYIGTRFDFIMRSTTATVTFVVPAGVTLDAQPGVHFSGAGNRVVAIKAQSDYWVIRGNGLS